MTGPSKSMRAWQLVRPGELRLETVDVPEPGDGEVLARVSVALTCGTDLKTIERGHARLRVPGPLGHEWAGVVEAVGAGVRDLAPGDRVVGTPTAPCGEAIAPTACAVRRTSASTCSSTRRSVLTANTFSCRGR